MHLSKVNSVNGSRAVAKISREIAATTALEHLELNRQMASGTICMTDCNWKMLMFHGVVNTPNR
jgi:hypothetical protein